MQCKEWGDANSELFKEPHDEAVHKNSYKSRLCELISASLRLLRRLCRSLIHFRHNPKRGCEEMMTISSQPFSHVKTPDSSILMQ